MAPAWFDTAGPECAAIDHCGMNRLPRGESVRLERSGAVGDVCDTNRVASFRDVDFDTFCSRCGICGGASRAVNEVITVPHVENRVQCVPPLLGASADGTACRDARAGKIHRAALARGPGCSIEVQKRHPNPRKCGWCSGPGHVERDLEVRSARVAHLVDRGHARGGASVERVPKRREVAVGGSVADRRPVLTVVGLWVGHEHVELEDTVVQRRGDAVMLKLVVIPGVHRASVRKGWQLAVVHVDVHVVVFRPVW